MTKPNLINCCACKFACRARKNFGEVDYFGQSLFVRGCPWCDKVKKYLQAKGVEYETHDIELSDADREECEKISGDLAVPVTTVDGVNYVVGFDKRKIDELLGLTA